MTHYISSAAVEKYAKPPSPSVVSQVKVLHETIRDVFPGDQYLTILQGSYKNDTAVKDINDVDIVVICKKIISGTFGNPAKKSSTVVSWDSIFQNIKEFLTKAGYGVVLGDKCLKVKGSFDVDVVPAVYTENPDNDPVAIFSFRERLERKNYPRIHAQNGEDKNQGTNGQFKPMVRMFKVWSQNHFTDPKIAPSYYIESLIYNMPNELFVSDKALAFTILTRKILQTTNLKTVAGDRWITGEEWPTFGQLCSELAKTEVHLDNALKAPSEWLATQHWKNAFNE